MARGGRRSGSAGSQYSNRTDLQAGARSPAAGGASPAYGDKAALERGQQAVPVPTGAGGAAPSGPTMPPAGPPPGGLTPLGAPTQRPDEPLTAGLSSGAGPGPEALQGLPSQQTAFAKLNEQHRSYVNYLVEQDDLPPRVARFLRAVRNS